MQLKPIETHKASKQDADIGDLQVARALAAAAQGDVASAFELGVIFSTGTNGVTSDLVEAHKWFNIAAACGHEDAGFCRADVADEMTAREIAEAQRRARQWLAENHSRAA